MAPASMTGFARAQGTCGIWQWTWEIKSLNGRGLDIRLRLPQGWDDIELPTRACVAQRLKRGSCQINLQIQTEQGADTLRLNHDVLEKVLAAAQEINTRIGGDPPSVDALLGIRGLLDNQSEVDTQEKQSLQAQIMDTLETALDELVAMRLREGASLATVLLQQLDDIAALVDAIAASPACSIEAIRERIGALIERLVTHDHPLDPDRLHQEAVLYAAKADIREELDRLGAHIAAARELIRSDAAIGRRLDFLAQEFNREVNTISSKSGDIAITRHALALKSAIEQMREQIQNIE